VTAAEGEPNRCPRRGPLTRARFVQVALAPVSLVSLLSDEDLVGDGQQAIGERRAEPLQHRQLRGGRPDEDVAPRVLCGEHDRFGDRGRMVDRRDGGRALAEPGRG
jgi:hypothetical protein